MPPPLNLQRRSFDSIPPGSPLPFSHDLEEQISTLLDCGSSIFLFLNRLGIARELKCNACSSAIPWETATTLCPRCGSERISEIAIGIDGLMERCRTRWPRAMISVVSAHQQVDDSWLSQSHASSGRILIATSHALQDLRLETIQWSLVVGLGVDALRAHPSPAAALQTLQLLVEIGERYARPSSSPMVIMTHTPELPLWDAVADLAFRQRWYASELEMYRSVGLLDERTVTFRSDNPKTGTSMQIFLSQLQQSAAPHAILLSSTQNPSEVVLKIPSVELTSIEFYSHLRTLRGQWSVIVSPLP